MTKLPESLRLTSAARDRLLAQQTKCGRTACKRTYLTCYNTGTEMLYCSKCAAAINQHNPGLCIPYDAGRIPTPGA